MIKPIYLVKKKEASSESTREERKYSRILQKCSRERLRQAQSTMHVIFLTTSQNLKTRPAPLGYDVHNAVFNATNSAMYVMEKEKKYIA